MEPNGPRELTAARWLVPLTGAVAALLYANFLIVAALDGHSDMTTVISMMEEPGQPYAVLLRVTDVVCAVLVVAILPAVRRALPPGAWSRVAVATTALFALCAAAAGIVPARCEAGWTCTGSAIDLSTQIHDVLSTASDTFLYVGMAAVWVAVRRAGPVWLRRVAGWGVILGGLVSSAAFTYFNQFSDSAWATGASQRVHVLFISAWIVVLGVVGGRGRASRPDAGAAARESTTTRAT